MKAKGPQFIRFLKPIIEVLRESGGSGTSSEVTDKVIERLNIPEEEQSIVLKSGQSRVYNQVHWGRYEGSVSPSQVRDFRGAMEGRADKGIIITTGTFTVQANKEARRDGAKPIELVNGDDLIDLFESLELGLTPRITYDVDENFFDEYRVRP